MQDKGSDFLCLRLEGRADPRAREIHSRNGHGFLSYVSSLRVGRIPARDRTVRITHRDCQVLKSMCEGRQFAELEVLGSDGNPQTRREGGRM
jgi:hypothetical protein